MTSTHEQWDIVSGVGITALAVAGGRAVESQREDRLINDPYAADLVAAAGSTMFTEMENSPAELLEAMSGYLGVRTRFFDEYFLRAAAGGVQQAVILASGLDTRAFRLAWPEGLRVFEIDQPKVLQFKDDTLNRIDAEPGSDRRVVPVDLRDDWASALEAAGFDATKPTAWLAEGLLPYLPPEAEAQLLATVDRLSAPGSRLSIEHMAGPRDRFATDEMQAIGRQWGIDLLGLFSTDDRPDPEDVLKRAGWQVRREPTNEIAAGYGRELPGFTRRFAEVGCMLTAFRES
ncbi:class I SAM-dependent methyltransferase [Saccharopolyspora sp. NPDC047091]|uniref:class I SAM-dependent methyltransferase n=1 Tax=Saccharopolyspora sp. NPDC047091 TaxID=3155924 RepID=UPI0033C2C9F7